MADLDSLPDDDEFAPKPSKKKPILIGLGVAAVVGIAALVISSRPPSLNEEEQQVFEKAQASLRSDDYAAYPDGEARLQALLEKYPNYLPAISWLMQMYCAWGETLKFESQAFQEAARNKGAELAALKKTVETSKSKSTRGAAQKQFDAGKAELEELNKAGKLKDEQGTQKLKDAKLWAQKGSAVAPDDPQLQRAMADHSRVTQKWTDVETRLEYVKKHKPDSAGYRFISGAMLMERDKKFDEAIKFFEEALQVDPQFTRAQYFIGLALDGKGEREKASEAMKKVLAMSPNHPGARAWLGMVTTIEAARKAAGVAELAGTDKEHVAQGDEVNPPEPEKKEEEPRKADKKAARKKKKK